MESSGRITSLTLGVAGVGLSAIALLSPGLRGPAAFALLVMLVALFVVLRFQWLNRRLEVIAAQHRHLEKEISRFRRDFDVHKKLYNLEKAIETLEMKSRRGEWDPLWGIAILAILVLLFFVFKAAGLF